MGSRLLTTGLMGWRDWFKGAPPAPPENDPQLGALTWIAEQDGWCGVFNGYRFILAHESASHAPDTLKGYAFAVLQDGQWLQTALTEAVRTAPSYLKRFQEEMAELSYDELHFSIDQRGRGIFATLGPGRDYRCWRLEFTDRKCEGIGFDS